MKRLGLSLSAGFHREETPASAIHVLPLDGRGCPARERDRALAFYSTCSLGSLNLVARLYFAQHCRRCRKHQRSLHPICRQWTRHQCASHHPHCTCKTIIWVFLRFSQKQYDNNDQQWQQYQQYKTTLKYCFSPLLSLFFILLVLLVLYLILLYYIVGIVCIVLIHCVRILFYILFEHIVLQYCCYYSCMVLDIVLKYWFHIVIFIVLFVVLYINCIFSLLWAYYFTVLFSIYCI